MGGTACKAKVILNGGAVQDGANRLCYLVDETEYNALTDDQWIAVIEHLNEAENAVNSATKEFLEALGFEGPWPKSLK